MVKNNIGWLLVAFGLLLAVYSIFSYSLTDPNLVLSSWGPYWQFQQWMWQNIFINKNTLTTSYYVLMITLFCCYTGIVYFLSKFQDQNVKKKHLVIYALLVACLAFSYNTLSHDVFNYIFNAKMVLVYQENPHQQTALEYPNDPWTRFMHNTHTSAPYGYGWTALSLLPSFLGNNIFIVTWLLFRALEIAAVWLLYVSLQTLGKILFKKELSLSGLATLFLNPLFLIEVISNMHNDLWMIIPAIWAVIFILRYSRSVVKAVLYGGIALSMSISTKFATVVLLPPLLLVLLQRVVLEKFIFRYVNRLPFSQKIVQWITARIENWTAQYLPLVCSILLFIPLCLPRSQYFHPWYLLWSLSWIPLIRQGWWRAVLMVFSVSSMFRYIPWLYVGGFENNTLLFQQAITWGVPLACLIIWLIKQRSTQKNILNPV